MALSAGDELQVFALVCPIGANRVRLATLGAIPAARDTGAAPRLLDHVLAQARSRGAARVELEVFARNTRALMLYRSRGFEPVAELFGDERAPAATNAPPPAPQAVTREAAIAWLRDLTLDVPGLGSGGRGERGAASRLAQRRGPARLRRTRRRERRRRESR